MEVRYSDAKAMEPIRRTFLGTEEEFIGYKKFLSAKATAKKTEEVRKAMMKARKSKLAALRRVSVRPSARAEAAPNNLKVPTHDTRDYATPHLSPRDKEHTTKPSLASFVIGDQTDRIKLTLNS